MDNIEYESSKGYHEEAEKKVKLFSGEKVTRNTCLPLKRIIEVTFSFFPHYFFLFFLLHKLHNNILFDSIHRKIKPSYGFSIFNTDLIIFLFIFFFFYLVKIGFIYYNKNKLCIKLIRINTKCYTITHQTIIH